MDRLTFSFDAQEAATMADKEDPKPADGEMTLTEMAATLKTIVPQIAAINEALAGLSKPAPVAEVVEDKTTPPDPVAAAVDKAPPVAAMDEATFLGRMKQRNTLASQLSNVVGTFDHADMTLDAVVAYGCEKLKLAPAKGAELAMLSGYLAAKPASHPPAHVAMDAATVTGRASFADKLTNPVKEA
jgi:hypothetical protein